jgi:hypothetical protein
MMLSWKDSKFKIYGLDDANVSDLQQRTTYHNTRLETQAKMTSGYEYELVG